MKQETTKYHCDNCNAEMLKHEHEELAISIILRIELPNPKGGCGQASGYKMTLCKDCCKEIGIENTKEYHDYIYSQNKLRETFKSKKKSVLNLFKEKFMNVNEDGKINE